MACLHSENRYKKHRAIALWQWMLNFQRCWGLDRASQAYWISLRYFLFLPSSKMYYSTKNQPKIGIVKPVRNSRCPSSAPSSTFSFFLILPDNETQHPTWYILTNNTKSSNDNTPSLKKGNLKYLPTMCSFYQTFSLFPQTYYFCWGVDEEVDRSQVCFALVMGLQVLIWVLEMDGQILVELLLGQLRTFMTRVNYYYIFDLVFKATPPTQYVQPIHHSRTQQYNQLYMI